MYIAGKGHEHVGPGTSMVQFVKPNTGLSGCRGMGACGCGGKCGGLGLFDSGTDFTGWGLPEWGLVALGGYMIFSTLFTTRRAAARVGEGVRRTRKRIGKRISG